VNCAEPAGVVLREVLESDLPVFFEHQRDPDAVRMAAFPPRDRDAFWAHWSKVVQDKTLTTRTVLYDGRVAGHICCFERNGKWQVGDWIGKEFWGRGAATSALAALLCLVKRRPLYAYVAEQNVASIRVLEKCGFIVAGHDRSAAPTGGEAVDEVVMKLS